MTNLSKFYSQKTTKSNFIEQKRKQWVWFSAVGCGFLLCTLAFIISSFVIYNRLMHEETVFANNLLPTATLTPSLTSTAIASPTAWPSATPPTARPISAVVEITQQPTTAANPKFGSICFKSITNGGNVLSCDNVFPPTIIEVHAIFDYFNMKPQENEWIRIWYHNGQEVLNVKEIWSGDVTGQFDYNLNTTDGNPLSSGTWELELYVNGQLQSYSAFVVESQDNAAPAVAPNPNPPVFRASTNSYQLAYTKWDGNKHAIWVANLDGTNQRFLLDFAASPSWSPDGQKIAFYGEEGIDNQDAVSSGTNGVWVMGKEGQNPTQLQPEGTGQVVNWSPLGNLIAFDAARGGPDRRVYFVDATGNPQPFETLGEQPSFSPDGQQVVVKVCRPQCGLWIVAKDDSNPRQLTTGGSDGLPVWSPDGTKIAFSRNVDSNVDIYVIDVNGASLKRLTDSPGLDSVPVWTPDSQQIIFRTTRNGVWQIFGMNADGSNQYLIIDDVGASNQWAFDRMSVR